MYHVYVFDTLYPYHIYGPLDIFFDMGNIVTAFFAFFACFFFHFRENNDKVPKRSKNGPKKVPI